MDRGSCESPLSGRDATNQRRSCGTCRLPWCRQATAGRKPFGASELSVRTFGTQNPPLAPFQFSAKSRLPGHAEKNAVLDLNVFPCSRAGQTITYRVTSGMCKIRNIPYTGRNQSRDRLNQLQAGRGRQRRHIPTKNDNHESFLLLCTASHHQNGLTFL